ncbi:ADP-ribose glycohydrolase MACROD1 isoform X1 [Nomascus leucogenys]|uniref:ADP-ribose glycohydrolase MACROD1 isoform X3 n=1 Tax=Pan paniscus TaxID=9597 RepID=UPI0000E22B22|nr:ADP-ribose glycohydrolase MACROD1 isoform X1 [Pan paniscus]XP_009421608.1 ADP-ribose glycohydrolase MACROD1 isoform X1 [Pan troglodytes]XP_018892279.1 ADP-ribose glycohydrolase MACROD1 isoform X1 [Gorilla gorilla gorilla]XP_030666894.1 ADP-ribose glycohydrolase MACROD1 isoform X1 [Nomascus leucogenys]
MSLQSRLSGRLAQLRAAGQLLVPPRPRPGHLAGATRTRSSTCGPPAFLGVFGRRARTSAGVGAWGAAAVGRTAGVRTWAPLAMAAKVDLSTSTDWKEAKSFLKGLSDKQREEHYFCKDFVRLKKIPTWKEMAKGVAVKVEEPRYKKDKQLNEKISLLRSDITKLEVDAIVNAANSSLLGGGGVDGCIHRAAGPLLTDECRTLQSCETGKAKITGGYRLPAKYVIHTVGPIAYGEPSASQAAELRSCYLSSLDLLLEHRLRSVAFPCISTGVFGYPCEAAAEIVLATLREWLEQHKDKVDRLIICVFLEKDEDIYRSRLPHYFPVDPPSGPRSQL